MVWAAVGLLLVVLWLARKPLVGLVVPIRTSSRLYLSQQLTRYGIEKGRLPKPCLQELADRSVRQAQIIAGLRERSWRENVTEHLDGAALNIASILDGTFDEDDPGSQEYAASIRLILRKHRAMQGPAISN